jgi:hypothetical protein
VRHSILSRSAVEAASVAAGGAAAAGSAIAAELEMIKLAAKAMTHSEPLTISLSFTGSSDRRTPSLDIVTIRVAGQQLAP